MLAGKYYHQIDEKGRIRIPAKFKEELGNVKRVFITRGTKHCLFVFTEEAADKIMSKMKNDMLSTSPISDFRRQFSMWGGMVDDDQQGRTLIPHDLIEYAGIEKNVVTLGNYNRLEIWSQENWEKLEEEYNKQDYDKVIQQAAAYLEDE